MKKTLILLGVTLLLLALSACSGAAADTAEPNDSQATAPEVRTEKTEAEMDEVQLSTDYANALSKQSQLALGTIQLEDTELAVDEALAAELLPLWQALQSLSNSDTTAEAELRAVVNQIQETMTTEQIQAIAGMQLTDDGLTELFESGELAFGGFGSRGNQGNGDESSGIGRGFGGGFPGGPPGGGPGGGAGGGPGGGFPGGGFGNLSEDDIATRQAQFTEGDLGEFQDRALIRAVEVLLQTKTGEPPRQPGGIFNTVFTIVSEETGLSVEDIRSQTAEGVTLAEIIESNGGDVEAVRALLIEALNELPDAADLDVEQLASDWLGGGE